MTGCGPDLTPDPEHTMTTDEMIEFMQKTVAAQAMTTPRDRRAILRDLSPDDLNAVQEFLTSFTTAALTGRATPAARALRSS